MTLVRRPKPILNNETIPIKDAFLAQVNSFLSFESKSLKDSYRAYHILGKHEGYTPRLYQLYLRSLMLALASTKNAVSADKIYDEYLLVSALIKLNDTEQLNNRNRIPNLMKDN